MGTFAQSVDKITSEMIKGLDKAQKQAMRKGLQAGVKEYKRIAKPLIPLISKATDTRSKGTLQRNLRHRIKIKSEAGELHGVGVIRIRRPKGKRMAAVRENTKDRNDPFYWFLVDRGTKYKAGVHFIDKAKASGQHRANQKALSVYLSTFNQSMSKFR